MKNNENKALATKNSAFMALKDFNLNDALTEELSGLSGSSRSSIWSILS